MKGTVALEKPSLWPGGDPCEFTRADVVSFGKLRRHGDFVTRFLVRLADERIVFVKSYAQPEDDGKWLRKLADRMSDLLLKSEGAIGMMTSRDNPVVIRWMDVPAVTP